MTKQEKKVYIAIDLKSFYASVECMERGLNPLTTLLVVADKSRTSKTICLAVSPALKEYGTGGRPRLFEVEQKVKQANTARKRKLPDKKFNGKATDSLELGAHPEKEIDFLIAPPQMAHYIKVSASIYETYLKYVAPEDIHVYSIDEVFIDATPYLASYGLSAYDFTMKLILDVLSKTGITATAGIGSNLYLAKIAMDIEAKHQTADENGVRIAELDEMSYREKLWNHRPITDFWRVGAGYAGRLEALGLYTMGDVARCSLGKAGGRYNEDLLYKTFGINAELLIDHAWGYEPCTIADIKAYKPESNSLGSGQVLQEPYPYKKALLVTKEMADSLALDLVANNLVTSQLVLSIGYDVENLTDPKRKAAYKGDIEIDAYGRYKPSSAHGSINLQIPTASSRDLMDAVTELYQRIVQPELLIRRITITATDVVNTSVLASQNDSQLDLFAEKLTSSGSDKKQQHEEKVQKALLNIKKRFGKNAILRGINLEEGATAKLRNKQIGGHKA